MKKNLNIPNLITFIRIGLSPIFVIMMILGGYNLIGALIILTIAAISDFYDGKLAREYKSVTKLGTFLDPLADKILLSATFLSFYVLNLVPLWPIIIILFREFLITFLRITSIVKKQQMDTLYIGKIKTTVQFVAIYLMIFHVLFKTFITNYYLDYISFNIAIFAFYTAMLVTIYSGIIYLTNNNRMYEFVSTFGYIGYFPVGPGTVASLLITIALFFLPPTSIYSKIILIILLFVLGMFTSDKYSKNNNIDDPSCVVIDEICAMALILSFTPKTIYFYALAFILFRFFDITKIPFIWRIEKRFNSGFGIMFDDIVAAAFSIIIIQAVKYLQFLPIFL